MGVPSMGCCYVTSLCRVMVSVCTGGWGGFRCLGIKEGLEIWREGGMALNLTCCFPKVGCCFLCCLAENWVSEVNPETTRAAGTVANERVHTWTPQSALYHA